MKHPQRVTRRLEIRMYQRGDYARWREAFSTMLPPRNQFDKENLAAKELTRLKFYDLLLRQKKHMKSGLFYGFGVFNRRTGELVGRVGVMDIQRGISHTAYIGYTIFNRHWGKGYGKEAVRAVIDIAFQELKLHRIEAGVEPQNRRSILLARSLGLRKEGLKKRAVHLRDKWVDLVIYSATTEDFGMKWRGSISQG